MYSVGSIVSIFAPSVGYVKYHLCIEKNDPPTASKFLWLNSDPKFDGTYNVPCKRVPCIPPSKTGFTCFSFGIVLRYTDAQLSLFGFKVLGSIEKRLALELEAYALTPANIRGLNGQERRSFWQGWPHVNEARPLIRPPIQALDVLFTGF